MELKTIKVSKPKGDMPKVEGMMYPPSFHVNSKQIPEIKNWEVGKKYRLTIEVEQKSMNEGDDGVRGASFDLVAYAVGGATKEDNKKEDKKFKRY